MSERKYFEGRMRRADVSFDMSVRSKKLWEPSPRKPGSWTSRCCCVQWKPCFLLLTPGIAIQLQPIDCVSSCQEDLYKFECMKTPTPTNSRKLLVPNVLQDFSHQRFPDPWLPASQRKGARKRRKATSPCLVKAGRAVKRTSSRYVSDVCFCRDDIIGKYLAKYVISQYALAKLNSPHRLGGSHYQTELIWGRLRSLWFRGKYMMTIIQWWISEGPFQGSEYSIYIYTL